MKGSAAKYWISLVILLAAIYGSFVAWRSTQSEAAHLAAASSPARPGPAKPLEDFVLTDQDGQKFDSASLKGKVWVGSFFFTNCPGTCWKLNQALADLQRTEPGSEARFVSLTCDPDNDTPPALKKYAEHFHADPARWSFLTGDFKLLHQIGNDFFQVAVEKGTHTDRAFVVDREGKVRGRFRLTDPEQVEMLKKLLAVVEAEPAAAPQAEEPAAGEKSSETPS